jgi:hypothetical protein
MRDAILITFVYHRMKNGACITTEMRTKMTCSLLSFPHLILLGLDSINEFLRWLLSVTFWIILSPTPQILTSVFQGALSLPSELGVGQSRISSKVQYISITARSNLVREITANSMTKCFDHVEHRRAFTGPEIPGFDAGLLLSKIVERNQVTLGKIQYVDIVTDGSSNLRGIVYFTLGRYEHGWGKND